MAALGDVSTVVINFRAASSMAIPPVPWPDVSSMVPPIGAGGGGTPADVADTYYGSVS